MTTRVTDESYPSFALPAFVQASIWEGTPNGYRFTLADVLQYAKASLLVSDQVYIQGDVALYSTLVVAHGWRNEDGVGTFGRHQDHNEWMRKYGDFDSDAEFVGGTQSGPHAIPEIDLMIAELERGIDAGVFDLNGRPGSALVIHGSKSRPEATESAAPPALLAGEREGYFANLVLGQVPAFRDADLDVLLDVRTRIEPQRRRLVGAIAGASLELRDVRDATFADAAEQVARRDIGPAIAEIDAVLTELRVIPTLLRLAGSREVVTAVGASALTLAAARYGAANVAALAQTLAGTPALAAGAREALERRRLHRLADENRFALLHGGVMRRLTGL